MVLLQQNTNNGIAKFLVKKIFDRINHDFLERDLNLEENQILIKFLYKPELLNKKKLKDQDAQNKF